jgi:hypothetical protein
MLRESSFSIHVSRHFLCTWGSTVNIESIGLDTKWKWYTATYVLVWNSSTQVIQFILELNCVTCARLIGELYSSVSWVSPVNRLLMQSVWNSCLHYGIYSLFLTFRQVLAYLCLFCFDIVRHVRCGARRWTIWSVTTLHRRLQKPGTTARRHLMKVM